MNYTIANTYNEATDTALSVPGSYEFFGATTGRCAFVWTSYAEKRGVDYEQTVVRFFENMTWIDTWYPKDRETAERLTLQWVKEDHSELLVGWHLNSDNFLVDIVCKDAIVKT